MAGEDDSNFVFDELADISRGLVARHLAVSDEVARELGREAVDSLGIRVIVIAFTEKLGVRAHSMSSDCHDPAVLDRVLDVSRRELRNRGVPS